MLFDMGLFRKEIYLKIAPASPCQLTGKINRSEEMSLLENWLPWKQTSLFQFIRLLEKTFDGKAVDVDSRIVIDNWLEKLMDALQLNNNSSK